MNPNDYQRWTRSTAIYPSEISRTYLFLGLASEAGELLEQMGYAHVQGDNGRWQPNSLQSFAKEAGDLCWYIARIADEFEIAFDRPVAFAIDYLERTAVKSRNPKGDIDTIVQTSCYLCGLHKKVLRDSDGEWQPEQVEKLLPKLNLILVNLIRVLHTYGLNLETVLEINQQKLDSRKSRGVLSGSGDER